MFLFSFIAQYEIIFVNFYADWCRFSRILAPLFEEAYQKILQEVDEPNRVLFAKVDCEPEGMNNFSAFYFVPIADF